MPCRYCLLRLLRLTLIVLLLAACAPPSEQAVSPAADAQNAPTATIPPTATSTSRPTDIPTNTPAPTSTATPLPITAPGWESAELHTVCLGNRSNLHQCRRRLLVTAGRADLPCAGADGV